MEIIERLAEYRGLRPSPQELHRAGVTGDVVSRSEEPVSRRFWAVDVVFARQRLSCTTCHAAGDRRVFTERARASRRRELRAVRPRGNAAVEVPCAVRGKNA